MNLFSTPLLPTLTLLASTLAVGAPATAQTKQAIKAGTIITMDGDVIKDGVILMDGTRIEAIGKASEVEVPWDAEVTEAPEMTAMPGFVEAHSVDGTDRTNETLDVVPFFDVQDSVNPVDFYFEDCLRFGITTINVQQGNNCVVAAQGAVVKPFGATVEAQMVRPHSGVKMSVSPKGGKSRATQAAALRQAFSDLRAHLEQLVTEKRNGNDRARREALAQGRDYEGEDAKGRAMKGKGWKVEGLELVPRVEIDEKMVPLLKVVEGSLHVYMYCGGPSEVHTALAIAKENGFMETMTLVLGSGCFKAADAIAAAGVPVILSNRLVHIETDPITEEETKTFEAKVFQEKGVTFALTSNNSGMESLWYQAALAVGQGLSREEALAAVTTTPAAMLGLGDRVGALKAGADANVVLYDGDPLSVRSQVQHVFIDGNKVYDRSADPRLKQLFTGERPPGTAPAEDAGAEEDDDEESDESEKGSKED